MRGKVLPLPLLICDTRITPASCGMIAKQPPLKDHPRLCGEKYLRRDASNMCIGSPPPMRGKAAVGMYRREMWGITPAYAGKSTSTLLKLRFSSGSPPPMRGKGVFRCIRGIGIRITPAYAGKRVSAAEAFLAIEDHPRLCGEKIAGNNALECKRGSPPPMRGKDRYDGNAVQDDRITPAYAGKRSVAIERSTSSRDHPRLCGEKFFEDFSVSFSTGSPPPMRGKGQPGITGSGSFRITPAYAGKRGVLFVVENLFVGSPPPMRGKALSYSHRKHGKRITPAYAGKSKYFLKAFPGL